MKTKTPFIELLTSILMIFNLYFQYNIILFNNNNTTYSEFVEHNYCCVEYY